MAFAPSVPLLSSSSPLFGPCLIQRRPLSYAPRRRRTTPSSCAVSPGPPRLAQVHRQTGETDVHVTINLDGSGACTADTGIPFLDHMLAQVASHGLVDLEVRARGDTWVDDHHTNEDVGIALGTALARALGERRGVRRFGHFVAPLDEALVQVALDFSGRGFLSYDLVLCAPRVGRYDTELVKEFYEAVARNAACTLHVRMLHGGNSHHVIEASFKAFARALRMAVEYDPRRLDQIPSSKGVLTSDAAAPDPKDQRTFELSKG